MILHSLSHSEMHCGRCGNKSSPSDLKSVVALPCGSWMFSCTTVHLYVQCESKKIPPPPWNFLTFFPNRLGIFSWNCMCLLYIPIYTELQIFIQLPSTLTKLCHIKRDHHNVLKISTIDRMHAGWSHLIWHNFVTVGDNLIKICILAFIRMFNRHVKFGLTVCEKCQKVPPFFGRWWTFCAHDVNWVVGWIGLCSV